MAIGKKTGGRDFEPGQSGNPYGRPTTPEDVREARELNKSEIERVLNKYIYMNRSELSTVIKDPKTPALDIMVISIINKATQAGDHQRFNFILERLIGKVKDDQAVDQKPAKKITLSYSVEQEGQHGG